MKQFWFVGAFFFFTSVAAHAEEFKAAATMPEVVVTASADKTPGVRYLEDVQGTKIYSGKKTSVIDLQDAPVIVNNNYRQALEKTPGLLLSEESTPLFSVGYRGLNPHRAQFTQVLKDGIPIHADMFGYPEAYYTPALQAVDHIDFIHGGAALMYGPQPGGALNFVTKDPYAGSPIQLVEENSVGSRDLYSNYTALTGTQGPFGYYGYFHHRQSQGFRDFNSQYEVYYGGGKFIIEQDPTAKWTLAFDIYEEAHGEPGGLTRFDFDHQPEKTTRLSDRLELNRYAGSAGFEKEISENTDLELKGYGVYYERLSWRQRGGGFGTISVGASASTNAIEDQAFYTGGVDARVRHDYAALGSDEHTFSGGVLYHHTTSPRTDERGLKGDAEDGVLRNDSDREVDYFSVFLENLFRFEKFSITPGVRFENIWQSIRETVNVDKTAAGKPLSDEDTRDFVVLAGVGAAYEVAPKVDLYANYSEGYRPKIFTEAVPTSPTTVINADLEEGNSWQADLGLRGKPVPYFSWDASVFHLEFDGQIGSVSSGGVTTLQNVGDAEHEGVEVTTEVDLIGLWDAATGSRCGDKIGSLSFFYNAMFLDAEFIGGPVTGKTPQYAPDFIQKGGGEYRYKDRAKIRFAGTFVDDHFANDSNTPAFTVPSYKVWDLTAEFKIYGDLVSVFGGVNNIFDEHYFARVRSDGIDPADGRNYYAGVKVLWG
ncbi:MAG: TonB-dependent receptor family protein [Candidatus Omnitrophota bacterium]